MYISLEWAAGFIEGDGCFSVNRQSVHGRYSYPKIEIHQKNLEPLYALRDQLGFSITTNGRLGVAYMVGGKAQSLYSKIYPLLSSKRRAQAERNLFIPGDPTRIRNMDWFAGYYEAEGCIHIKDNGQVRADGTKRLFSNLSISQYYSNETSNMCLDVVGYGIVGGPWLAKGERRAYAYSVSGKAGIKLIESISNRLSEQKLQQLYLVKQKVLNQ